MTPTRTTLAALAALLAGAGCTGLREWGANGFKVGPRYTPPVTQVAERWTPANDPRLTASPADMRAWWGELHDPVLADLMTTLGERNPTLRRAALKVEELAAVRGKTKGNLLPQSQSVLGAKVSGTISKNLVQGALQNQFKIFADGFMASWELDIWGRYRRAVEASDADLAAAVEEYRDTLSGLLADAATSYVDIRAFQQRLVYARQTVQARTDALALAEGRFQNGTTGETEVWQARMAVARAEAAVQPLELGLQQASHRLSVLTGSPAHDLAAGLPPGAMPAPPPVLAVGVPADLLRRRPDVRKAERDLAAQSARIGVAKSDLYPAVSLFGFFGYTGTRFRDLFRGDSYTGIMAPSFDWKILNYGRVLNNIRAEDARFQQLAAGYDQAVLTAGQDVEDALAGFLRGLEQADNLARSVIAAEQVVELNEKAVRDGNGAADKLYDARATALAQKDAMVLARRDALLSLIKTYRALGGGWDCGLPGGPVPAGVPADAPPAEGPPSPVTAGSASGPRKAEAVARGG